MFSLLISLSSFGAAQVGRYGQRWCADVAAEAGADGVEVRGELLRDPTAELVALRGRATVYSSPDGLFAADGTLDAEALAEGLRRAGALQAPKLKMAIGGFDIARSRPGLEMLRQRLAAQTVALVIENDQTERAGTLDALQRFFAAQHEAGLDLGMTFDIGNWHWLGECPLEAARAFAPQVRYVHCKGVQRRPDRWVAVPPAESSAPWRAVLRALPADVPHAIEYPLVGDDLVAVAREQLAQIRAVRALS